MGDITRGIRHLRGWGVEPVTLLPGAVCLIVCCLLPACGCWLAAVRDHEIITYRQLRWLADACRPAHLLFYPMTLF